MKRLLMYARPYWLVILISLLLLVVDAGLQVLGPLLTKTAVDRYLAPAGEPVLPWLEQWLAAGAREGLIQIAGIYFAMLAASLVLQFGQQFLMQWTGQRAMFDLRRDIMSHLQKLDVREYDRSPVGRLVTRVTTDVDALNELFAQGLVTVLGDVLVLLFIVAAMFRLSPGLTLLMILMLPLALGVTVAFRRIVQAANRRVRVAVAKINSFLQEHIAGVIVLQLFNREDRAARDFEKVNQECLDAHKETISAYGWFYPAVEFVSLLGFAALLAWGGTEVRAGTLSMGVLVAFFQYGMRVFRPIQDLSEKYNILLSAMAAAERIFLLMDKEITIEAPERPRAFPGCPAEIEFDDVWFAYNGEDWVLRGVSFRIQPGESIAIVGHTGAGKTTITNLLLRFYDVTRGAVRIGGVDVREMDPRVLRQQFGVVLQDPFLFTGTIGGNIRLGNAEIGAEQLERAAEQVNLLEYVRTLPAGFEQEVRERGAGLSTGQKQLIGFARALVHEPRYLILDEATSSVDTETEIRVRAALERLVSGRTSLIVAHRLSTIQRANRIFVMHKGKLRETGTHQELLAMRGIYWKLYRLQYQEQEQLPQSAD
ncbi:MAG: ABC transporter ATP-binding protein/permease [Bryobacteraceae bacterium]|nr:ABC transporter ATP-binding protein [Solibacteraceae bacterium]MCO5349682.1 ABC transporter ATP-binding protein/permease [Bryobacteraceae bacterium]